MTLCRGCDLLGRPTALSYSYYSFFLVLFFFFVITSGCVGGAVGALVGALVVVLVVVLPTLLMTALLVLLVVAPASRDVEIPPQGSVKDSPACPRFIDSAKSALWIL